MNDRKTSALGNPSAEPNTFELGQGEKNLPEREHFDEPGELGREKTGETMNEKESIELIARMISATKNRFEVGDGNILLNWGILIVAIASAVWAAVAATGNPAFNGLWALTAFGWIFNRRLARKQRTRGYLSYTDRFCATVWGSVGILGAAGFVVCVAFRLATGNSPWMVLFFYALFVVGFGVISTGAALKLRSMVTGGIFSIVFGMVLLGCIFSGAALSAAWVMPGFILCFCLMMIVPGLEMRRLARKEHERA